jgi:hypothetical protein
MTRVITYDSFPNKKEVTWQDVREAALNPSTTPFTISEIAELVTLTSKDEFLKRMFEMLKNEPNQSIS